MSSSVSQESPAKPHDVLADSGQRAAWDVWLSGIAAGWFIAGYLLPNTLWENASAAHSVARFLDGMTAVARHLTVSIAVIAAALCFARQAAAGRVRLLLWLGLLTALVALAFSPGFYHLGRNDEADLDRTIEAAAAGLTAAALCGTPTIVGALLTVLVSGQCVYALWYQEHGSYQTLSGSLLREGGSYHYPEALYVVVLLALPISIGLASIEPRRRVRLCYACSSILISLCLTMTWYRGAFLAAAVAVGFILARSVSSRRAAWVGAFALLFVVIAGIAVRSHGARNAISAEGSEHGRWVLWQAGWEAFCENWLTGSGPISVHHLADRLRDREDLPTYYLEPKNLTLFVLDEFGIGGGLLLLTLVIAGAGCLARCPSPLTTGIAAAWMALLVAGLFDTPFGLADRVAPTVVVSMLYACFFLLPNAPRQDVARPCSVS